MDLERIKQNFRIRSGRNKQQKKKPKSTTASESTTKQVYPHWMQPNGNTSKPESFTQDTPQREHSSESRPEEQPEQSLSNTEDVPEQPEEQPTEASDEPQEHATSAPDDTNQETLQSDMNKTEQESEQQNMAEASSEAEDLEFDLKPPKPRSKPPSLETISELLFSSGHLDALLHNTPDLSRFSRFMQKYVPQHHPLLSQYLETQKAIKAVAYANAIAEGLKPKDTGEGTTTETRRQAASLDSEFEAISNASFKALVGDALPSFISYLLVKTASECLTNEITGRSTPFMRDLVGGLSEVFCLTDPNQHDNPIIYASEEFYRLTRYGPEDTLNNNCRFLQGRKTNPDSPRRLKQAIQSGEEISETLLNYTRDGKPFLNLLMVAPLHDRKGKLKYHIGAQIDVTGLVEGGRALPGFQRYLVRKGQEQKQQERERAKPEVDDDQRRKKRALARLRDLSDTFDLEESAVVQANSRSNSSTRDDDDNGSIGSVDRTQRRVYGDSDASDVEDEAESQQQNDGADWKLGSAGDGRLSGKLPGVYDSFMLIRPAPSLRIVFVSPKLRKIGTVLQTPFLSHVAAPNATLTGLAESLRTGVPVSAKIHFKPERGENRDGTQLRNGVKHEDGQNGKAIWVSCTPLLGGDERVGVWMCVVVEKSKVGAFRRSAELDKQAEQSVESAEMDSASSRGRAEKAKKIEMPSRDENTPIKPVRINTDTVITKNDDEKPEEEEANTPDKNRSAKSIRQMESVYFDANGGQEPEIVNPEHDYHEETASQTTEPAHERSIRPAKSVYFDTHDGHEEREEGEEQPPGAKSGYHEDAKPQSAEQSETNHSGDQHTSAGDHAATAVETPVEEYTEPDTTDGNNDRPSSDGPPPGEYPDSGDEYVKTRSPALPAQPDERVLIQDDSDVPADEKADLGSQEHDQGKDSRPPSPTGSPASDIPPSIPSSAQLPSESEDDVQEEDFETPRQPKYTQPVLLSDEDEQTEHEQEPETGTAASRNGSQDRVQRRRRGTEVSTAISGDENQEPVEHSDEHQVDLDASTPTLSNAAQDHKTNPDEHSNDMEASIATLKSATQNHKTSLMDPHDHDRDSAISMETSDKPQSKARSPPSIPASQKQVQEDDENTDESKHQRDVQHWVDIARPSSSKQDPGMKMDYLAAGSSRWTRPPGLGRGSQKWNDDRFSSFDECLGSPNSVD